MATLKLVLKALRWLLTAFLALGILISLGDGLGAFLANAIPMGLLLFGLWGIPWLVARERSRNPPQTTAFREGFEPELRHDNIALDAASDTLWVRDASGAERYLGRGDIIGFKTAHDWNNGTFRQRLEIDVKDVSRPRWDVLFQRHSDTWIKTSKRNGQERDEWFARLRAWDHQGPSIAARVKAAGIDMSLPGLHRQYYEAKTDEDRQNWLVAFDIGCDTEDRDQKTEWERLGGTYPGPSPELLKFGKGRAKAS